MATNARLCLNFQQGFCHQGDLCRLKHERKKREKKEEKDELEYLKPFKSAQEIEAEKWQRDIEMAKYETGWRSRFSIPGKPIQLMPNIRTMKSHL